MQGTLDIWSTVVYQHHSSTHAWQIFGIRWKKTLVCIVEMSCGRFVRRALSSFCVCVCERHVEQRTGKGARFTPLQSTTKAAACWLGATKASCVFWFLMEKQNCKKKSLALSVLSVLPSETEKDLGFQSHMKLQLHCLSTAVGVQNLAAPSIVAKWIHYTGCTQADVRGEQPGLLSTELPGWDKGGKYSLLAINSNIW